MSTKTVTSLKKIEVAAMKLLMLLNIGIDPILFSDKVSGKEKGKCSS